ncbi:recombinase family protein [Cytobacillus sp. FSL R5-0596]|uniref:recombinase family protein n=1 Tax=Cytobacillus sp. FSL R5-0596 TaxID=2954696 RepID=UPI0030F9937E
MRVAIYRRVSTEMQKEEGFSLEAQTNRLNAYALSQGWTIVEDYADEGFSAKNIDDRPAMQRLIRDLKKEKFDIVLVYKLDRLVRSVTDLHSLLSLFEQYNVKFKSATEEFNTTSALGRLFITLVAAMAAWERENLSERVHMGMKQMVLEGKRAGAKAPFGYEYQDGKLIINEMESKWVKYIFDNYKTKGQKAIATQLNDMGVKSPNGNYWRGNVVYSMATNPIYAGYIRWNYRKTGGKKTGEEVIVKAEHEPFVTKEHFDELQDIITGRSGKGFKGNVHYPFTGVLKCARCGYPMIGGSRKRKTDRYRFYRCSGRFHSGICDMPIVGESAIEEEFLKHLELPMYEEKTISQETDNTEEIERQLAKINKKMALIKELYTEGDYTKQEYRDKLEIERKKEEALTRQLATSSPGIDYKYVNEIIHNAKNHWQYATYEERKEMIHTIVENLTIDVIESHKGGPGTKAKIAITNYQMK